MSFENIWLNIKLHEGETFYTVRGCECSYEFCDTYLKLKNPNRNIPKWQVKEACKISDLRVKDISNFMAPSYIVAILNDSRIR